MQVASKCMHVCMCVCVLASFSSICIVRLLDPPGFTGGGLNGWTHFLVHVILSADGDWYRVPEGAGPDGPDGQRTPDIRPTIIPSRCIVTVLCMNFILLLFLSMHLQTIPEMRYYNPEIYTFVT